MHSPPRRGGVARQLIEAGAPGWSVRSKRFPPSDHPVCAASPLAVGASTPPLRGGELHTARDCDAHQVQSFRESLTHEIHNNDVEKLPRSILFGNDPIPVIKQIESLREREGILRKGRGLERDDNLMAYFVDTHRKVDQFPDVMRLI